MTRYYGKYRGLVTSNLDPNRMGRLQVACPQVLGENLLAWAMPCVPFAGISEGFFMMPMPGSNVWVEFEAGDPDRPIWSGCFWTQQTTPFAAVAPTVRMIKTLGLRADAERHPRRRRLQARGAAAHGRRALHHQRRRARHRDHLRRRHDQARAHRGGREQRSPEGDLMPSILNVADKVQCPHAALATHVPSQVRVLVRGAAALTQSDLATIAGCAFTLPGGKPSPCVTIQWVSASVRVTAGGLPLLLDASVGLCKSPEQAPQGAPIVAPIPPAVPPAVQAL